MPRRPRAIDLYSGVGGWSLGLRLADIDVVASYDRSGPANETNFKNNHHHAQTVDIRRLDFSELPRNIDIVVGSPPCTQFSFSNRGGGGDMVDGLEDIARFLSIVDHVKPTYWAMENVPRVAKILERELTSKGRLSRFKHLPIDVHVFNLAEYGVPQKRRRCIAGKLPFDLLRSYSEEAPEYTLGDVIKALSLPVVVDPLYGIEVRKRELTEHIPEQPLTSEETRINRALKSHHPVYNAMQFPDALNKPARTVTATCTRVSRESIVVAGETQGDFRRLTLREKACLQGFPITYQFYAPFYDTKAEMIGNAIPPAFAYLLGSAMRGVSTTNLRGIREAVHCWRAPAARPEVVVPNRHSVRYKENRTFRFAVPALHLKSGVRFELANSQRKDQLGWQIAFYFGTSKEIKSLRLDTATERIVQSKLPVRLRARVHSVLGEAEAYVTAADVANMQRIWSHRGVGRTTPFMLLDQLDAYAVRLTGLLRSSEHAIKYAIGEAILAQYGADAFQLPGLAKLARNAPVVCAGLLLASRANEALARHMVAPIGSRVGQL